MLSISFISEVVKRIILKMADQYIDPDKLNTSELVYSGIQTVLAIAMIAVSSRVYRSET